MNAKHTPGWETSKDAVPAGHIQITVYEESTGKRVATVFEAEAARLIAAAPKMYDALLRVIDSPFEPDKWRLNVQQALEAVKAEGKDVQS